MKQKKRSHLVIHDSENSMGFFVGDGVSVSFRFTDGSSVALKAGHLRDIVWSWVNSMPSDVTAESEWGAKKRGGKN